MDNNKSKKIVALRLPNILAFSSFSCLNEKIGGCHWKKGCIEIPERGEILGNLENMITMRWDREPLQKGLTNVLKIF